MRIAIVHEWLTSMRGGEKCVEAMCEVFPNAEVFTLLHRKGSVSPTLEERKITTSFIQRLPFSSTRYRHYLPLFPAAINTFDLSDFDIVISSNHCVAKGVRTTPTTLHICYCYTPMRYIWNLYDDYFSKDRAGLITRTGMKMVRGYLRRWDVRTAKNPHYFVAISKNIQSRIEEVYKRTSDLIYPPVDTDRFTPSHTTGKYYLMVSALVPYKRVDLAIDAFNRKKERLVIVGDGPDAGRLRSMANTNIEFVGFMADENLGEYYRNCKALLFPGEEDFGIVPLEAMACGKPVIAFAKGGALETVLDSHDERTGILFGSQTVEALLDAVDRFEKTSFNPQALRRFADRFEKREFKMKFKKYVDDRWAQFSLNPSNRLNRNALDRTTR